ncbi:MAG: hypothetical protein TR69_WS6001000455 [candidate division WS6 bacterium OLB20]|uniref:Uncharacterized protein n=1 Tax=candidate division WS6 bacterium OLB20 TaxID=1617426 RepID=A0A136LXR8_9BACT|nr:MAG: hypothetical protein TR69_WS6001000455 [candidate division WS6 bacterium OLB20]
MKRYSILLLTVFVLAACTPGVPTDDPSDQPDSVADTQLSDIDTPDEQRRSDVTALADAISRYRADNPGSTLFDDLTVCNSEKLMIGDSFDLSVLVPDYLAGLPRDPEASAGSATGYSICRNNKGEISIWAENAASGDINEKVK